MDKVVYIVHCVDTEGPLYESIEATFERINNIFGIWLEPSQNLLRKLQNREFPLSGQEEAIANLVSPERLNNKDNWDKIDNTLDEITSEQFRNEFLDSFKNGWIYNWFCLDHIGFSGENPRRRDLGFHKIFDHYENYIQLHNIKQDRIFWHFHPVAIKKDAHRSGNTYVSSNELFKILARKIIDRSWFPAVFRPGYHMERPDSNWFLEQWIPFDFGNQAKKGNFTNQPDIENRKLGDWRRAPNDWRIYHPDHDDYQKEGECRRWIARCLNMEARHSEITIDDIRDGFERVVSGKSTIISFTNHDFRDMKSEIIKIRNMIKIVSEEFSNVKFKYSNALEAMRGVIRNFDLERPEFSLNVEERNKISIINIKSKNEIFGSQPFFALKTRDNHY
ncbi:hypothetical protein LCGC14_2470320, partial [marine sediment metagenome]